MPEQAYIDSTLAVYEFNQIDLLRDVFSWAYERSCRRYLAITQTMAEPNPLGIRYREVLILVVQAIVRNRKIPSAQNVLRLAHELVPQNDQEVFVKMVLEDLHRIHEGSVARFRLKLSDFQAWKPIRDQHRRGRHSK